MRVAPEVVLTAAEQAELAQLAQSAAAGDRLAQRARIVLLAASGLQNKEIAARLQVGRVQVARWRERYVRFRRPGIEHDLPRGAPSPRVDVGRLRQLAAQPNAQWSTRSMAAVLGVSPASVSYHWRGNGAKAAAGRPGKAVRSARAAATGDARAGAAQTAFAPPNGTGDSLWKELTALKRERILQEASQLFYERGYAQTSVDAIAERVGATKPFVYAHFASKRDLLVEVCERSNREALAAAERAMAGAGSPRERFAGFVREFTDVVLRLHQHVAIYFREQSSLPPESAERINQMRKSISSHLSLLLAEGVAAGEFQIGDPRMAALVIAGMSSYAFAWYRDSGRLDRQEVTQRITQMALKLVSPSSVQLQE